MHVDSQKVYLRLGLGPISRRSFWFDSSEGPRKESALGKSGENCRAPLRHLCGRALLLFASWHDKAVQGFAYVSACLVK